MLSFPSGLVSLGWPPQRKARLTEAVADKIMLLPKGRRAQKESVASREEAMTCPDCKQPFQVCPSCWWYVCSCKGTQADGLAAYLRRHHGPSAELVRRKG